MPIYEFYCPDNNKLYSFLARTLSMRDKLPACPDGEGLRMERRMSRFAVIGKAKEDTGDDPFAGIDETKMDEFMMQMENDMAGLDENNPDPRQLGHFMRKMTDMMGDKTPPELREMVRRLESGEDPEKLEEEFGGGGEGDLNQHLTEQQADVILAAFGFNESFKGQEGVAEFETLLKAFLIELKSHHYNGRTVPQIVLVSPTAAAKPHEKLNAQIAAYVEAMRKVAKAEGVGFADVFTDLTPTTMNGVHLDKGGYAVFSERLYHELTQETAPKVNAAVRAAVVEKETKFFQHYRPLNYYYIKGGRAEPYGVVNFPNELEKLKQLVAKRDEDIWNAAQGKPVVGKAADKDTLPLPVITGDRPVNEWVTPAEELKAFKIDPRFEVNCFASEEDFPDLFKKPIAIRFDARGRLWVSTSTTYPQILPGEEPQDQILILEDTNGDHKADKCSVWADKLHIPLSFEFGNGGVYVSDQPNLTFLKDTDGDGNADKREKLLTGFGTEDSHHALHDFVWSPEGDLIFRESIFHHSQVETPYGPVRARESSFFPLQPGEEFWLHREASTLAPLFERACDHLWKWDGEDLALVEEAFSSWIS